MTEQQAIALHNSGFWETMTYRQRAEFQMHEERLCMPFDVFHKALEETLGRPIFTSELGMNTAGIKRELMGDAPAPTMEQIIEMIPAEKRVLIVAA